MFDRAGFGCKSDNAGAWPTVVLVTVGNIRNLLRYEPYSLNDA
jgi:hypothetical protein